MIIAKSPASTCFLRVTEQISSRVFSNYKLKLTACLHQLRLILLVLLPAFSAPRRSIALIE